MRTQMKDGAIKEKRLHQGGVGPEMRSLTGHAAMLSGAGT